MPTVQDYLNLITSEHQGKPDFEAVITACVSVQVQVQAVLNSMVPLFDLSTPPVGNQLDIIGQWVGASRHLSVPIAGVYFSWDDTAADGWDFGTWQSSENSTTLVTLPDDAYLTLILAKIAANHWDGTTEGAYKIWDILFPDFKILIQDNEDMSYNLIVQGIILDSVSQALLTGGELALKPEGIRINQYVIPVNTGPLFGFDVENSFVQGWDQGSWGVNLSPT